MHQAGVSHNGGRNERESRERTSESRARPTNTPKKSDEGDINASEAKRGGEGDRDAPPKAAELGRRSVCLRRERSRRGACRRAVLPSDRPEIR
jgi:hypothetical protein